MPSFGGLDDIAAGGSCHTRPRCVKSGPASGLNEARIYTRAMVTSRILGVIIAQDSLVAAAAESVLDRLCKQSKQLAAGQSAGARGSPQEWSSSAKLAGSALSNLLSADGAPNRNRSGASRVASPDCMTQQASLSTRSATASNAKRAPYATYNAHSDGRGKRHGADHEDRIEWDGEHFPKELAELPPGHLRRRPRRQHV